MTHKLGDGDVSLARQQDSFAGVGLNLRLAYGDMLSMPADPQADAMLKLLLETSVHDMASC